MSAPEGAVPDRSPGLAASTDAGSFESPFAQRRTFDVSPEEAVRGDGGECPVAQACRQMWPGCEPHIEGDDPHVILADGTRQQLRLGQSLIEDIGKFDRGEGGFELGKITIVDNWGGLR